MTRHIMIQKLLISLFVFLTFTCDLVASESESIAEKLKHADSIRSSDNKQFISILESLKKQEDQMNYKEQMYFLYLSGYRKAIEGEFKKAEQMLTHVYHNTKQVDIKFRSQLLLANTFAVTREFTKGLAYLEQAMASIDNIKDKQTRELGFVVASIFYNQVGEYNLGHRYAQRLIEQKPEGRNNCIAHQLLLESEYNLDKLKLNAKYFDEGLSICTAEKEPLTLGLIWSYKIHLLLENKQYNEALAILKTNINSVQEADYTTLTSEFYALFAKAYFHTNDLISATTFANRVLEINDKTTYSKPLVSAYDLLFKIAQAKGDYENAVFYAQKFNEADKGYLNDVKARNLAFQLARHEVSEKNSRIKILNKQNEVLKLEQALTQEDSQNKRLMIAILLLIIVFIALWAYKTKRTHVKLRQLAEFDSLTGIHNRRHFTKLAEANLHYHQTSNQAVSFILFDIDKFKSINDNYGHPVGDWALKMVPKAIQKIIRKIDIFGRIGGEEFAILLPGCELDTARMIAEECRKELTKIDSTETGYQFRISASFGVTVSRVSGYDFDLLVSHSDQAMYKAKSGGRNRVSIYKDEIVLDEKNNKNPISSELS